MNSNLEKMDFVGKRRRSFCVIFLFTFLGGVEYAVIFPTLWEYLLTLGVPPSRVYYLGLCISALTMTDMAASLVVGRILDRTNKVAPFFLLLNVFQVLSCGIYLLARSPGWVLVSRLVGGLGNVIGVALMTDVCRATSKEERTPILVGFSISQQVGLLLGPACNLFLREINFTLDLGSFVLEVNKLNAPGLFMGVLYVLLEVVVFAFYYDLAEAKRAHDRLQQQQQHEQQQQQLNEDQQPQNEVSESNEASSSDNDVAVIESVTPPTWSEYLDELLRGEIVALFFLRVIGLLGQTCFETILTPMTRTFFNYGDFENSIIYLAGGGELVVVSLAMAWISKRVEDRKFVAFGVALHFITLLFFLTLIPSFEPGDRGNLPVFATAVALDLASISIILDIALALATKLLRDEVQGFATGVRRFTSNIAILLGPLWGGGALPWERVLFAVPVVLLCVGAVLFALSYPRMKVVTEREENSVGERGDEEENAGGDSAHVSDESTPLLINT